MDQSVRTQITQMIAELSGGNATVLEALMPHIHAELKDIAQRHLYRERPDHTLNATALVNEAYLKLVDQRNAPWQNRAHFCGVASQAMRRILVDHARKRMAEKRGGGEAFATFNEELIPAQARAEDVVNLDEALERLSKLDPRRGKVVEYSFFGGMTHQEIAEVLGVSVQTVRLDWRSARAWLSRELKRLD